MNFKKKRSKGSHMNEATRGMLLWCAALCCWLLSPFSEAASSQGYDIGTPPGWVNDVAAPTGDWVKQQKPTNGIAYLLVDRQWKVEDGKQKFFNHVVSQALSVTGVEEVSQISIEFDPVYQSLTLHKVAIIRNGVSFDRLDRSRISLIQREKDLENQTYDGSKTLNILIEDVRPGDIVEYSYTMSGENPIFSGHFFKTLETQWSVPVGRLFYRLLCPNAIPLHIKNYQTDIAPTKTRANGYAEYIWRTDGIKALVTDDKTPNWYDPYGKVYLSDMTEWSEVVNWAYPLYWPIPDSRPLRNQISMLESRAKTDEARVLNALRFVQEQIRYVGIEAGINSHRPSTPEEVIVRRYGDCKDKSRLLVALLRGMGIEADPALVNTAFGPLLKKLLPTPAAFDHVIVRVRLNGVNYWLDPTRTYQEGNLENLYQPDYDYALVISKDVRGLAFMSDDITMRHSKQVYEVFNLSNPIDVPATYKVLTTFDHYYADSVRETLSSVNLDSLQKKFLNYTAKYYPSAEYSEPLSVKKNDEKNSITVIENYRIPGVWQASDDNKYLYLEFEPFLIFDHVRNVESPKRTAPYAVAHPVRYHHTTRIIMPKNSEFENEYHEVLDSAFKFTQKVDFKNDVLVIDYLYESLADHVDASDIERHAKNIREVRKLSTFQVKMLNPASD
jgi:transglutaminase-like putative cysteine protease